MTCPADPAPSAESTSEQGQSAHGTGQAPGSGQEGLTLFESLVLERLNILIQQNDEMISLMLDEPEQGEEGELPTHYLNGSRIS